MADVTPGTYVTMFIISITLMVFFTTAAANRIDKMDSPNQQFVGTCTLFGSYFLLFLMAWLIVVSKQLDPYPALYKSMQIVFAAFIVPGFVLLWDVGENLEDYAKHPDFSIYWTGAGLLAVLFFYLGIVLASPGAVN
jgi:uncharacterized membrane protein (DUF4010 family)